MGRVRSMRSNRARAAAAMAAVVLGAGLAGLAEAQPSPRWSLALDGGAEYDTNIHRCETGQSDCAVQAGPLARWSARLGLGWQPRPAGHLQIVGFGGARLFAEELHRGEDVAVVSGDARYVWDLPARRAGMGVRAAYYDTFGQPGLAPEADTQRHFVVANGELHLTLPFPVNPVLQIFQV